VLEVIRPRGPVSGSAVRERLVGAGFRDIGKTKSTGLIFAAIISDLRLTQGTGSVKIHGHFESPASMRIS